MAIHIAATLHRDTIEELLRQLLPLKIPLDPKRPRWIEVERPEHVGFVEGVGLRVATSARVQWTVAGVPVGFTIRYVQLLIRPEIVGDELGGKLVFRVVVEDADLKGIPSAIDQGIVSKVNERLGAVGDRIGWDFGKTLRLVVPMPPTMRPVESYQMRAQEGAVAIGADFLRVSLYLPSRFKREGEDKT
jgi:hypothetical protein